ncbi:acyl carrier protein [Pedobacter sp. HDW13]|uniref:acyl carrier protein n=1 Tax=Pedobacter sp. HDW13 TaxID=2714940 RepID=UPI00140A77E8|nr:acyl carrier protein [Pedobacter sp. HDW13]QIL39199.1 acyl carrier protein [Pedobacter sp. HDW13]
MELQDFINNFASQFDDTDSAEFTADLQFHDLEEWSSLNALSIIAMVDEEYGVKLTGNDIREAKSVQDLFDVVKGKK